MGEVTWRQMHPNPGLDPGFRVDPRGQARFLVDGYSVDLAVKYISEGTDEVEMTASITINGVKLAESSSTAEWGEYYILRSTLDDLLKDVVSQLEYTMKKLQKHIASFESRKRD